MLVLRLFKIQPIKILRCHKFSHRFIFIITFFDAFKTFPNGFNNLIASFYNWLKPIPHCFPSSIANLPQIDQFFLPFWQPFLTFQKTHLVLNWTHLFFWFHHFACFCGSCCWFLDCELVEHALGCIPRNIETSTEIQFVIFHTTNTWALF